MRVTRCDAKCALLLCCWNKPRWGLTGCCFKPHVRYGFHPFLFWICHTTDDDFSHLQCCSPQNCVFLIKCWVKALTWWMGGSLHCIMDQLSFTHFICVWLCQHLEKAKIILRSTAYLAFSKNLFAFKPANTTAKTNVRQTHVSHRRRLNRAWWLIC